jgi:hypothetical protein
MELSIIVQYVKLFYKFHVSNNDRVNRRKRTVIFWLSRTNFYVIVSCIGLICEVIHLVFFLFCIFFFCKSVLSLTIIMTNKRKTYYCFSSLFFYYVCFSFVCSAFVDYDATLFPLYFVLFDGMKRRSCLRILKK